MKKGIVVISIFLLDIVIVLVMGWLVLINSGWKLDKNDIHNIRIGGNDRVR